jgi:serine/threonine protein kinase
MVLSPLGVREGQSPHALFAALCGILAAREDANYVGRGGYGVVYSPPLMCEDQADCPLLNTVCTDGVSKLLTARNSVQEKKLYMGSKIDTIDPRGDFHCRLITVCEHRRYVDIPETTQRRRNHIFEYGGVDLKSLLQTKDNKEIILKGLLNTFQGIQLFHTKNLYHLDIKLCNLVMDISSPSPTVRMIDFGLSQYVLDHRGPPLSKIYHKVYIWPFELTCMSTYAVSVGMETMLEEYVKNSIFPTTKEELYPVLTKMKQLYRLKGRKRYRSHPLYVEICRYALCKVDLFQMGLVLANNFLLGPDNSFVKSLVHANPSFRPTPREATRTYRRLLEQMHLLVS